MSIQDNVVAIRNAMIQEVDQLGPGGGPISKDVKAKAIEAIMGGAAEWVTYMSLYSQNPAQLARLIPSDGTEDNPSMREARAYLVANAVCTPGTATGLLETVHGRLDNPPV